MLIVLKAMQVRVTVMRTGVEGSKYSAIIKDDDPEKPESNPEVQEELEDRHDEVLLLWPLSIFNSEI